MLTKTLRWLAIWNKVIYSSMSIFQYRCTDSWDDSSSSPLCFLIALGGQFQCDQPTQMKIKSSLLKLKKQEPFFGAQKGVPTSAFQNVSCFSNYKLIDFLSSVNNQPKSLVFYKGCYNEKYSSFLENIYFKPIF